MKNKKRFFLKASILLVLISICINIVSDMLIPKYTDDTNFPTSATYSGFYKMEKDSIDVIFLGSSRASCAFSPQELYNLYNIRSYNLGCEMQNILVSYYWLKEAFRFQNPKVVVLETGMIFPYRSDEPLNTSIECTRKAMDYMKWSNVKMQAVEDICTYDETQSWESYVFPNIQYHDRWEELERNDFTKIMLDGSIKLKGQTALYNFYHNWNNKGIFAEGDSPNKEDMHNLMENYLDKIVNLCQSEGVDLILVSAPSAFDSIEKYNTMRAYSVSNNLKFIDYNEKSIQDQIKYDYVADNAEYHHAGINGSKKITAHLGKIFEEEYGLFGKKDEQWEQSGNYYKQIEKEIYLREVFDTEEYLAELNNDNYTIFMVAQNVYGCTEIPSEVKNKTKELGVIDSFWGEDSGNRYYAIIDGNVVIEENHHRPIGIKGTISENGIQYSLSSDVFESSITVDNVEYSKGVEGLNIVVYSNATKRIVDNATMVFENERSYLVR